MRLKELLREDRMSNNEIKGWLERWGSEYQERAAIISNGLVSFAQQDPIIIVDKIVNDARMITDDNELPFQLGNVPSIVIRDSALASFKNFPKIIRGPIGYLSNHMAINLDDNSHTFSKIRSLEGITEVNPGGVNLRYCKYLNYSKVHTFIKEVNNTLTIHSDYVGPILGFLNIKELKDVWQYGPDELLLEKALKILNSHLKGDKDIMDCQEELIQKGCKEFAKL